MTRSHSLVVHWDGKFIPDLIGRSVSDRIAILVSYDGTSKFLGSPMIKPSTGANIADADCIMQCIKRWLNGKLLTE